MHVNIKLRLYPQRGDFGVTVIIATIFLLGPIGAMWAASDSLMLAAIILIFWGWFLIQSSIEFSNQSIRISETQIAITRTIGLIPLTRKTISLSSFYGVRNVKLCFHSISGCQTELLGMRGAPRLPIRIEWGAGITPEAIELKSRIANDLGLESCRDRT
jgi:hypothetical protein